MGYPHYEFEASATFEARMDPQAIEDVMVALGQVLVAHGAITPTVEAREVHYVTNGAWKKIDGKA